MRALFVVGHRFPHLDKARLVFRYQALFGAMVSLKLLYFLELGLDDSVLLLELAVLLDVQHFKLLGSLGRHLSEFGFLLLEELVHLLEVRELLIHIQI